MGIGIHRGRRRAYLAFLACLMWVFGIEALPSLHVAMHAHIGAHRHEGGLVIPIETSDPADLDAQVDEHGAPLTGEQAPPAPAPDHRAARDAHARFARALDHGHGSAAHRDLALHPPAPAMHEPLPIDRRPTSLAIAAIATPISAPSPHAAARGPPRRHAR